MSDYIIKKPDVFSLDLILDCGQAFRWKKEGNIYSGVAFGKYLELEEKEDKLVFYNTKESDFENIWRRYFDYDTDYRAIINSYDDTYLKKAVSDFEGIRILRQEPWETLCSFIISQNNNIPRIKAIIDRLCSSFGEREGKSYTFPGAEKIANLKEDDLAPLRAGFRNKYIIDAARKVAGGEIDFRKIADSDIETGREELKKIKGVGDKVADCTLLYGFYKIDAFPKDVWVKRIITELYPDGLPSCIKKSRGIAQQYLFHWRRNIDWNQTSLLTKTP